jgi:hypothetical protein
MIRPVSAAVAGAVISGVVMYTAGGRAEKVNAFTQPAYVQTLDGQYVPVRPAYPAGGYVPLDANALQPPAATRVVERAAPRQTVYRTAAPAQERVVVTDPHARSQRSWEKTAMIIGGSAASAAGVGGIVKGKKGALIGAAIGGGAASIYEATRRR